jgi:hypothetical protein
VIILAETQSSYATKQHLSPTNHRHRFTDNAVRHDYIPANASMKAFREV